MIRVIVIDDHPLLLSGISEELKKHSDIDLIATANHGSKLLDLVNKHSPDVIILDLVMDGFEPVSAVQELLKIHPDAKILVLTGSHSSSYMRELLREGAKGYLLKSDTLPSSLPDAIRKIHAGEKFYSPTLVDALVASDVEQPLNQREMKVVHLIVEGLDNNAIAEAMHLSVKSIRNILSGIYDKMNIPEQGKGINPRATLIKKAREQKFLVD